MILIRSSRAEGLSGAGHTITVVAVLDELDCPRDIAMNVARQLKARMPADTFLLLIMVVGSMAAADFAAEWHKIGQLDPTVGVLMTCLTAADVMAGEVDAMSCTKRLSGFRMTSCARHRRWTEINRISIMTDEAAVIFYANGEQVRVGDHVDFDGEPATVSEIIVTPEHLAATGMPRPCVGFITSRMGEVFQSPADRGWEGIKLLGRQNQEI